MSALRRAIAVSCLALLAACGRPAAPAATSAPPDGSDAQRLVALADYVSTDYAMAVENGVVVSQAEYDEQRKFVQDAQKIARDLVGGPQRAAGERVVTLVDEVARRVEAKVPASEVAAACRAAKEEAVGRFGLRTTPTSRPSLPRAEAVYRDSCATCHGVTGAADTERARSLDPAPAPFRDPARLGALSPYRVYNTLTFGVPGTAMASFADALSADDRWSLAFYVFRLGHEGEQVEGPAAVPLADMAFRSDHEMLAALQREGHPAPSKGLAYVRSEAAFQEPPAGVGLDRTRALLRRAVTAFDDKRAADASRLVLDAYLQGFEPLEPRLRARDADATAAVERAFHELRSAVDAGDASTARARHLQLDERLAALAGGRQRVVPFMAALVIYLREGIEAALLVGAMLAALRKLGRTDAARYIHLGWVAALVAGVVTWWIADRVLTVTAQQRELAEAVIALLAAAVLFSMSFWLISKVEARRWMEYLRRHLEETLSRRNVALLAAVSFLAVYREAAETVLFTQALLLDSPQAAREVWMGALSGVVAVVAVAAVMNRTATRLPLGPFFAVSSALLCLLAISFAGSGLWELVSAGYLRPRPVRFPEIPWLGIHPDLTGLLVQLAILLVIAAAGIVTLRRRTPDGGGSSTA